MTSYSMGEQDETCRKQGRSGGCHHGTFFRRMCYLWEFTARHPQMGIRLLLASRAGSHRPGKVRTGRSFSMYICLSPHLSPTMIFKAQWLASLPSPTYHALHFQTSVIQSHIGRAVLGNVSNITKVRRIIQCRSQKDGTDSILRDTELQSFYLCF